MESQCTVLDSSSEDELLPTQEELQVELEVEDELKGLEVGVPAADLVGLASPPETALQPAVDTQASQARLLEPSNRKHLARRFARHHMANMSGLARRSPHDFREASSSPPEDIAFEEELPAGRRLEELYRQVLTTLQGIPKSDWKKTSRKNVCPVGESFSLQLCLGLVKSVHWRGIPMVSTDTYRYLSLTRLVLHYFDTLATESGMALPIQSTSIQITKNLESRMHRDKYNREGSDSFITGFSDNCVGGQTFIADPEGDSVRRLTEKLPSAGVEGEKLRGRVEPIVRRLVRFDGSRPHCTEPFMGERYAVVLFCLGTAAYDDTAALTREFLRQLGFRLPGPFSSDTRLWELPSLEEKRLAARVAWGEAVEDEPGRHRPPNSCQPRTPTTSHAPAPQCSPATPVAPATPGAPATVHALGTPHVPATSSAMDPPRAPAQPCSPARASAPATPRAPAASDSAAPAALCAPATPRTAAMPCAPPTPACAAPATPGASMPFWPGVAGERVVKAEVDTPGWAEAAVAAEVQPVPQRRGGKARRQEGKASSSASAAPASGAMAAALTPRKRRRRGGEAAEGGGAAAEGLCKYFSPGPAEISEATPWTAEEDSKFRHQKTVCKVSFKKIAAKLGRSEAEVRGRWREIHRAAR